jgi:3-carboxy-cis,cis-muconate cycloisomerase
VTITPSDSRIFGPWFGHPGVAAAFSDERCVEYMLRVEAALAQVLGRQGLIPEPAAAQIVQAASQVKVDFDQLRAEADRAGFPVAELVRQLRAQAGEEAGKFVHWGATTQDILDTARVLQIQESLKPIEQALGQLIARLAGLAERHRSQLMAGRTHTQQALPITFGYKVAGWLAPLLRHRRRLAELKPRLLVLQLGGAVGTLAAYAEHGPALYAAMAQELGLGLAAAPWHSQRDGFAEFAGWLSLLTGSLAKLAQDVLLMGQTEIGELRESADPGRGGSSAMPQKSNPVASGQILAAARANAALLASVHDAMVHEHERGTHGLQLEWLSLPQMLTLAATALDKAVFLAENLVVDGQRMLANLEGAQGTILAERYRDALAAVMGRQEAERLVREACQIALEERRDLGAVLRERTAASLDWDSLADPSQYLGSLSWFVDRVLQQARSA